MKQKIKKKFTMEDFKQGLMLAGLVTPSSSKEMYEREVLSEFEKKNENKK